MRIIGIGGGDSRKRFCPNLDFTGIGVSVETSSTSSMKTVAPLHDVRTAAQGMDIFIIVGAIVSVVQYATIN